MRLAVGIMILPHGMQKTLGWFGGNGFDGQLAYWATKYGLPTALSVLAIVAETAGGLGLILGCLTRIAAFGVFCNMLVAIFMVAGKFGFFMNWSGKQGGEGYEMHILALGLLIPIMARGAGALSVDRLLASAQSTMGSADSSHKMATPIRG